MAGMNTLPMIKMIPTFDGRNYVEWTRSFNDILQIAWPFLSKIMSGLERPEPIPREDREGEENASDFDINGSNSSEVSADGSRNSDEEPNNSDDIEAWGTANEHLFSVLRLTTTGATRSVLLKFEPRNGHAGDGKETWLALKNKYQNTSRQRRRTLLRRLDNSVMRSDIDPDVFLSEVFQLRDELNDLGETITDEPLTTTVSSYMRSQKRYTPQLKCRQLRDPDLGLEEIIGMIKTTFINHSERSSVPKRSKESYRKVRSSGRESRIDNVRESAMTLTFHNCKKTGRKRKIARS